MAKRFKAKKKRNFFFLSLSVFVISFAFFLSYFAHLFNTDKFLDFILKYELGNLIEMVRAKEDPFNKKTIEAYHQKYIKLVENENQNKTTNKE